MFEGVKRKFGEIKTKIKEFSVEERAVTSANKTVEIAIGVFVAAAILPDAITSWFNISKTGWSSAASTLWDLAPVLIVAGVIIGYYEYTKRRR